MRRLMKSVLDAFDPHYGINTEERWFSTNINRVLVDLLDLPHKPGYGSEFKISVVNSLAEPERWLLLRVSFIGSRGYLNGRAVEGWLVLLGYPKFPPAIRFDSRPQCPDHLGKHPHVYPDRTPCWEILAKSWSEGCELYADYIKVVLEMFNKPTEHLSCQVAGLDD